MDPDKFRQRIRRALPYPNIAVQCDATTTPQHLAKRGMLCAIVTYCPSVDDEGNLIEEGFHSPPDGE